MLHLYCPRIKAVEPHVNSETHLALLKPSALTCHSLWIVKFYLGHLPWAKPLMAEASLSCTSRSSTQFHYSKCDREELGTGRDHWVKNTNTATYCVIKEAI